MTAEKAYWGNYHGHLSHLFPAPGWCVMSLCERAYAGEAGFNPDTKRRRCMLCQKIEKERNAPG